MIRFMLLLISASMLIGCGTDVKSTRLTDVDLTDMKAVQELRAHLGAQDGAALATYAVKHNGTSASFCGHALVLPDGTSPSTVGEAIALTLAREHEERLALEEAERPRSPPELARQRWDGLTSDRDLLIDRRSELLAEHGSNAELLPEWAALDRRMSKIDQKLINLKPSVFGPDA